MITVEQAHNSPLLRKRYLFWEIDKSMIGPALVNNFKWVIPRVFEYGEIEDIWDVIDLYGEKQTKEVLSTEKLKPTANVMAYLFLGIDRYNRFKINALS